MTTSITVAIPDDVQDNHTHTVRVTSRDTRATEGEQSAADLLELWKGRQELFGYGVHEFESTDRDGHRVTLTWFTALDGQVVWLFETGYYTRVECARCTIRWAQAYVAVEQDGQTMPAEPLCDNHITMTERRVEHFRENLGIELIMHRSEPLHVGQH